MSKILYSHGGTRLVVPDETTHTLYIVRFETVEEEVL